MTDHSHNTDLDRVESDAQDTVKAITTCIDYIRNIDDFQPVMVKNAFKGARRQDVEDQKQKTDRAPVYFFEQLNEKLCNGGGLSKGMQKEKRETGACSTGCENANTIDDSNYHSVENDRHKLVYEICLPLLWQLGDSFQLLDTHQSGEDEVHKSLHITKKTNKKRGRVKKPNAPRGLLSLLNYTDIACMLEITVCTAIVPLLEKNVQSSIIERTKKLPKSLAGRLHRKCLHWGMETLQYNITDEPVNGARQELISEHRQNARVRVAMKIDRAIKELSDVVITISKLLLLDRFRPMLLPRHAVDIYSALFQLERLKNLRKKFDCEILDCYKLRVHHNGFEGQFHTDARMDGIRRAFLPCDFSNTEIKSSMIEAIDLRTMVMSYQSLLMSGANAPAWLKSRISTALTDLAVSGEEGLDAIVDVFVVVAASLQTGDMTVASSRLGRALCINKEVTVSHRNDQVRDKNSPGAGQIYFRKLLGHFLVLLLNIDDCEQGIGSSHNAACILSIWSVLDNIPNDTTRSNFFSGLVDGLFPTNESKSDDILSTIRRIRSLLLLPPTGCKAVEDLCMYLLFHSGPEFCTESGVHASGNVSAFGQLVRIATSTEDNQVLLASATNNAKQTIRLIIHILLKESKESKNVHYQYLAVSLMTSVVATNPLDVLGYSFRYSLDDNILLQRDETPPSPIKRLQEIEKRAVFVVNELLLELASEEKDLQHVQQIKSVVGAFFRLQLLIYFKAQSQKADDAASYLPILMEDNIHEYKIVSMIVLPLLCEKFSPEALLMETDPGANGVLHIVILIITSASMNFGNDVPGQTKKVCYLKPSNPSCDFSGWDSISISLGGKSPTKSKVDPEPIILDTESQLSITSIILSILVAVLELGSSNRVEKEENELSLLVPFLIRLSSLGETPSHHTENPSSALKAEIADMSIHAAALIRTRSIEYPPDTESMPSDHSIFEYIEKNIDDVEIELTSKQPPLRARAIVQLRKLAETAVAGKTALEPTPNLIIDISEDYIPPIDAATQLITLLERMLIISVHSLEDAESYVYLASIQTIVAMTDHNPTHLVPIILHAITSGRLTTTKFERNDKESCELTLTQRIKLVEAMNFIIRRRGRAVSNMAMSIMNSILFGHSTGSLTTDCGESMQKEIQLRTERYFKGDVEELVEQEFHEAGQHFREVQLRLKTGGPLFNFEGNDLVRASCISLLSELVLALHPSSVAPYCTTLVLLVTNSLQLDHSRLVRRAAASLCRELYHCSLREVRADDHKEASAQYMPFTLALISSGEDATRVALERAVAADDVDIKVDEHVVRAVRGKSRLFDSATIARCKEALQIYEELDESGIISVCALILKTQNGSKESSFGRFLSREFEDVNKTSAIKLDLRYD